MIIIPARKKFSQTNRTASILSFIVLFIMQLFSRGRNHLKAAISLFLLRFGGENHLKAAINLSCYALLRNPNSDFPYGKDRCFSPPNPHTPWLGQSKVLKHLREDEIRQRKLQTLASYSRNLVGVGTFDDPQARDFCKQIEQQPMMFALNFVAVCLS